MKAPKSTVTPAIRLLRERGIEFEQHVYDYVDKGGTVHAANSLGVPEHQIIKTIVLHDDRKQPLLVLMHGDRQISTRALARQLEARSVESCPAEVAHKHTGYLVGGVSPFGTRKPLPICVQASILELERIYINGGKRGLLISMSPSDLTRALRFRTVDVARNG